MFGIGAGELLVIFVIAIVVIGPKQLPEVARTLGKLFTTFKRTTNQLRDQMQTEVQKFHEMEEVKEFKTAIESEMYNVQETAETYVKQELETEEKRLEDEARNIDQAFSAEGGPASMESGNTESGNTAPSLSPTESDPSASASLAAPDDGSGGPAPVYSIPETAADPGIPAATPDPGETHALAEPAGGNGRSPAHATPSDAAASTSTPNKLVS